MSSGEDTEKQETCNNTNNNNNNNNNNNKRSLDEIGLPQKKFYRQRAHSNPLNDHSFI